MTDNELKKRNKIRTGHYIKYWGVPNNIIIKPFISSNELALIIFEPNNEMSNWHCATNGMSEFKQYTNNEYLKTELYAIMNNFSDWSLTLLQAIANYPILNNTYLSEYDTIPVGKSIDQKESPYTNILLGPVLPEDNNEISNIYGIDEIEVNLLSVIPITNDECDFAISNGGVELWKLMNTSKVSFCLDAIRNSVV